MQNKLCKLLTGHRLITVMKISILAYGFVVAALVQAAPTSGQAVLDTKITVQVEGVSLHLALDKISETGKVNFIYSGNGVLEAIVSINAKDRKLKELLDELLTPHDLSYKVKGKKIVITSKRQLDRTRPKAEAEKVDEVETPKEHEAAVQALIVTGRVTDERSAPIPGVNVMVKGTTIGTVTDNEGNYSLAVPEATGTLVFSYIGYTTIEVPIGSRTTIDMTMAEDVTNLDEVVVTAMGIPRQARALTYSTQKVNGEQLNEVRTANIANALSGKVAGMVVTSTASGPGSSAKILLRGNKSIAADNSALIVVDGVIVDNTTSYNRFGYNGNTSTSSDAISGINPDDVESINVLKGSAASALYGSNGANGVVLITTKTGKSGKMSVNINSGITFDSPLLSPQVQNEFAQGNGGVFGANSPNSWGPAIAGQQVIDWTGKQTTLAPQPDNVKHFFQRNAISSNNAIDFSGGTDKTQAYFSYANVYSEGMVPLNKLKRNTVNLRVTSNISKRFSADTKLTFLQQDISHKANATGGATLNTYRIPRTIRLEDVQNYETVDASGIVRHNYWYVDPFYGNPYWYVHNTRSDERRDRITGLISGKYQLTEWLDLKATASWDLIDTKGSYQADNNTPGAAGSSNGSFGYEIFRSMQRNIDVLASGYNSITKDFKIRYNVGATLLDNTGDVTGISVRKLIVPNRFNLAFAAQADQFNYNANTRVQQQAIFATAEFSFKDFLYLDGSARQEYFSTLPSPYYSFYPSVGLSAILSDMFQMPSIVDYGKVRVGYAESGGGGRPYLNNQTYSIFPNGIQRDVISPFPDLKPELTTGLEVGTEWWFFEKRLTFDVTVYRSNTTNQLIQVPTPPATGFSYQYINAGDIQNSGVEIVLNVTPLKRALTWNIGLNFAKNTNKVLEVTPGVNEVLLDVNFTDIVKSVVKVGGAYGDLYGYGWKRNASGERVVDVNGRPQRTENLIKIGNYNPDYTLGLNNSFSYKDFVFNVLIDGRFGGEMVSVSDAITAADGTPDYTSSHRAQASWILPAVLEEGSANITPINAEMFWTTVGGRYGWAEEFVYDATNLRLRELALGYRFNRIAGKFIKQAKLSLVARNVFFFYRGYAKADLPGIDRRKANFDSEINLFNSNLQGLEYGTLPPTRSIGLNLKLSF